MIGSGNPVARGGRGFPRLSRYDLVLAVIPIAFLLAAFASRLLSVPVHGGMALASTVGAVAVADALFLNPPAPRGRSGSD